MVSSGLLRRVVLVRADVSEEPGSSFIRVTRIGETGTLAISSNRSTLQYVPPKRQFLQEPRGVNIPEDGILHSHCRENLKSYNTFCVCITIDES
jgi:hypothetical protein